MLSVSKHDTINTIILQIKIMNKPKTPPCIGHDHETQVLEDIDTIMDTLIEDLMTPQNVIVLHNDDVNSFDLVIACLIAYCDKGYEEAQQLTLIIMQ